MRLFELHFISVIPFIISGRLGSEADSYKFEITYEDTVKILFLQIHSESAAKMLSYSTAPSTEMLLSDLKYLFNMNGIEVPDDVIFASLKKGEAIRMSNASYMQAPKRNAHLSSLCQNLLLEKGAIIREGFVSTLDVTKVPHEELMTKEVSNAIAFLISQGSYFFKNDNLKLVHSSEFIKGAQEARNHGLE